MKITKLKRWLLLEILRWLPRRASHAWPLNRPVQRIAFWHFGGIGDLILGGAVVRALLESFPEAEVVVFCDSPKMGEFFRRLDARVESIRGLDIYRLDACTIWTLTGIRYIVKKCQMLRQERYDLLVNIHIPKLLDWWFFEILLMRCSHARYLVGFLPKRVNRRVIDRFMDVAVIGTRHYIELYAELLAPLGIVLGRSGVYPLPEGLVSRVRHVVIHPGASKDFKRWPLERFAEVARMLNRLGWHVVIVGDDSERDLAKRMAELVPGCDTSAVAMAFSDLAAMIASCGLFIGNDSAPFHLAVAVGTPAVGIFGAGPMRYSNYPVPTVRIARSDVPCAPCFENTCHQKMECMRELSLDAVWSQVQNLVDGMQV